MIIYFDNAATSMQKPPAVATAVANAICGLGNPGRGGHLPAMQAARAVFAARTQVAKLLFMQQPTNVAFTSGITESLNLVIGKLINKRHHVITTVLEHNAVLRPLYESGCEISFLNCDDEGRLLLPQLQTLLKPNTRFLVCTTGSNVLGTATDVTHMRLFCQQNGLVLILDAAQTLGAVPTTGQDGDFICFTGHKGLLGPQGTGGIICCNNNVFSGKEPPIFKTGGTGSASFARHQPRQMPDMFEAGTPNVPGLCGLTQGIAHVLNIGTKAILQRELSLTNQFLQGLKSIDGISIYGPANMQNRLPVVSFNIAGQNAEETSLVLWEKHGIACRPGSHCAPLVHTRFATQNRGMVRFSFGYENTPEQVDTALAAIAGIAKI